jgi:hypothetical protein
MARAAWHRDPPEGQHAAAGGLGSAECSTLPSHHRLHCGHPQDYAVAYLLAYAPELNPEEQCNALVKRAIANALPGSVADLHRLARRESFRLQGQPEMIVSVFRCAGLSVAGLR